MTISRMHPRRWRAIALLAGWSALAACVAAPGDAGRTANDALVDAVHAQGVRDTRVLEALRATPRARFVPEEARAQAHGDHPLPIGYGQTISQPYIVALMTESLALSPADRVLEIGTGSGYQAAVLSPLVAQVYTIEIVQPLAERARALLGTLGLDNVEVRAGDGYAGWPDAAPFDAIIVTAAPERVPAALVEQLAPGGRMVVPVGPTGTVQSLRLLEKDAHGAVREREIAAVRFVPMTGGDPDPAR